MKKKKLFLGIFVFGIILFTLATKTSSTTALFSSDNQKEDHLNLALTSISNELLSLTPHVQIEILNDDNFTDYGFPGFGTPSEPYYIENYNITITTSKGIYINGTTKHFVIRNCHVDTISESIYISNVAEGTASIINNTFINDEGENVYLYSSSGATLTSNTCRTNETCVYTLQGVGIFIDTSSDVILTNNTCINNADGIVLGISSGGILSDNTCINNRLEGIVVSYSSDVTLTNNFCSNCKDGIYAYHSIGLILTNNTCSNNNDNGIRLWTGNGATLTNNTCSNTLLGDGIRLDFVPNSILTDNICFDNDYGIYLQTSNGSTLTNNICIDNDYGIRLAKSSDSTLTSNICSNNKLGDGIKLSYTLDSILTDNICDNNFDGISLYSSSGATLTNNTCKNNDGIGLSQRWGIILEFTDSCLLTYNLLQENDEYGIFLDSRSDINIIHHSSLIDNNLGGTSQACDEGTNNIWYDTSTEEGNYWNELNEEKPYLIDGDVNATDPYPLYENMTRIFYETSSKTDFEYTLIIPALILVAILLKRKRNTNFRL